MILFLILFMVLFLLLQKYFESLSGGSSANSEVGQMAAAAGVAYSPWTAMFAMQQQAMQFQQGNPSPMMMAQQMTPPCAPPNSTANPILQQLLQGISNVVAAKSLPCT